MANELHFPLFHGYVDRWLVSGVTETPVITKPTALHGAENEKLNTAPKDKPGEEQFKACLLYTSLHNTQDAVGQQRQGRSFLVLGQIAAGAFAADVFRTDGFLVVQGAADCGDGVFADGGVRIAQILVAAQHRDFDACLGKSRADIRELGGGDIGKIRNAPDSLGHGQLGGIVAVGGQHIGQAFGGKAPVIMGAAAVFHGGNLLV